MSVWLQELTWEQVRDHLTRDDVVFLPVGSTEQHGPHLPLGTDTMTAIGLARDAAARSGALVAPPLWFGWSPHHLAYPGTLTLKPELLTAVVADLCRSLAFHGFGRVVIVNGHREANLAPLKLAQTRLVNETGQLVVIVDPYYFGFEAGASIRASEPGGVGHADELETAHLLHLWPELVHMDRAVRNVQPPARWRSGDPYVQGDRVLTASSIEAFRARTTPSGVSGDPLPATAEKGRLYHQQMVENLVSLVGLLRSSPVTLKSFPLPI